MPRSRIAIQSFSPGKLLCAAPVVAKGFPFALVSLGLPVAVFCPVEPPNSSYEIRFAVFGVNHLAHREDVQVVEIASVFVSVL